jgi:hypothetical protein
MGLLIYLISSGVEYDPKVIIKVYFMEQGNPNNPQEKRILLGFTSFGRKHVSVFI